MLTSRSALIILKQLKDVQICINRNVDHAAIVPGEIHNWDGTVFVSLDIAVLEERCNITVAGLIVATINKKTHLALKPLTSKHVEFTGVAPRPEFQQALARANISPIISPANLSCTIAIILCGPSSIAESLARDLSKYRMFLQHPNPRPIGVEYANPQYLAVAESRLPNGAVLPPIPPESFDQGTDRAGRVNQGDLEDEVDLREVMNNLPRPAYLVEADIDGRIKTKLLP